VIGVVTYSTTGPLKEHMAICYSINKEFILNSSTHDVLEGALPYEIKLMLGHYLQNRYINLNKRLQEFNYGADASDKPS
jgi:hypothetical protein